MGDYLKDKAKSTANKIWQMYKGKIIMIGVIVLLAILLLAFIVGIIITIMGIEEENSKYNPMMSYGFWWPIGSQEITTDEKGNEYAKDAPSAISITSDYKDRNPGRPDHNGVDIGNLDIDGNPHSKNYGGIVPYHYIIASKDGSIITSHLSETAGEYIVIDHGNGIITKYMHMYEGSRRLEVGDTVKQGQIIGMMGTTGDSTGEHLHFQIELNGEVVDPLQYVSSEHPRGGVGIDIFDISISKEEFISCVSNYKKEDINYQNYMVEYAEDFYDICTEYEINPQLAFAHSCLETGYGSSDKVRTKNNYFGMGAYNENPDNASAYDTPGDSIRAYCDWIIDNATLGTSAYQANVQRTEELYEYNNILIGTPDTNLYVLYIRYAQLYQVHLEGKDGDPYYWSEVMYGERCNHSEGSPTTFQEQADYAVYTTNQRLNIIENIFGK